ncbi:hypothetical protein MAP00_007595 [Monascus purpureus]|nr:hypothetical protein MAP00_007595 [Monascus purpureus]
MICRMFWICVFPDMFNRPSSLLIKHWGDTALSFDARQPSKVIELSEVVERLAVIPLNVVKLTVLTADKFPACCFPSFLYFTRRQRPCIPSGKDTGEGDGLVVEATKCQGRGMPTMPTVGKYVRKT